MGYTSINRKIIFQASKMKKSAKPAAKPRKTQRPPEEDEPDPTPKRSRHPPKTPIKVSEEDNVGQSPMPETEKKEGNPLDKLPKIPKKEIPVVKLGQDDTKVSTSRHDTDISFRDILEGAAEVPSGTAVSESSTNDVSGDEIDLSASSDDDDKDHDGRLSDTRPKSGETDDENLQPQTSQAGPVGAVGTEEKISPPSTSRRDSAPVSSLAGDSSFTNLISALQGQAGWRSLFEGGDPFSGEFSGYDSAAVARKAAATFSSFSNIVSKLELENQQLTNRLIATESDKARLFASAGATGAGAGAQGNLNDEKNNKWRKNFKFNKTFNAGAKESVEEFLLELKQAFQRAQVKNEEQRLSTLLGALGDIVASDYARKTV